MEPEQSPKEVLNEKQPNVFNTVTPFSKYLAMALFVLLPFLGIWIGYTFAPEKIIIQEIEVKNSIEPIVNQTENEQTKDLSEQADFFKPTTESDLTSQIRAEFNADQWGGASSRAKEVLQKINYKWLEEISFEPFSFKDVAGEVIHYCDKGNTIFDRSGSPLCLGENVIVIAWGDAVEIVAEEDTPTQASLFKVHEIFFNEGKFEKVTESKIEGAKLLVVIDELACIDIFADVCFTDFSLSYVIDVENLQFSQIRSISRISSDTSMSEAGSESLIGQWPRADRFYWNDTGTKAVYETPCPAGCSNLIFEGFDLNSLTIVPLLSRVDGYYDEQYGGGPDKADLQWTSANEVQLGTLSFSF